MIIFLSVMVMIKTVITETLSSSFSAISVTASISFSKIPASSTGFSCVPLDIKTQKFRHCYRHPNMTEKNNDPCKLNTLHHFKRFSSLLSSFFIDISYIQVYYRNKQLHSLQTRTLLLFAKLH